MVEEGVHGVRARVRIRVGAGPRGGMATRDSTSMRVSTYSAPSSETPTTPTREGSLGVRIAKVAFCTERTAVMKPVAGSASTTTRSRRA